MEQSTDFPGQPRGRGDTITAGPALPVCDECGVAGGHLSSCHIEPRGLFDGPAVLEQVIRIDV